MKRLFVSALTIAALALTGCDKNEENSGNGGGNQGGNEPGPAPTELHESLKGTNYIPIVLDSESLAAIQGKVVADLRPNDSTVDGVHYNGYVNCWHWNPSFSALDPVGPNFYGVLEGWMSYTIAHNDTWYGLGIAVTTNDTVVGVGDGGAKLDAATIADMMNKAKAGLAAMSKIDATYSLHLALKSARQGIYTFKLYDGEPNKEYAVNIGITPNDGSDYQFARDGEWHEIIIPASFFINKGMNFANIATSNDINVLGFTQPDAGVASGASDLNLDAAFFYQPKK